MAGLTGVLATVLGRLVLDRTGRTGRYDVSVQWDDAPVREGGAPGIDVACARGTDHGSIFTAVENQLGLHLERQHAPVDIRVIDHIEKAIIQLRAITYLAYLNVLPSEKRKGHKSGPECFGWSAHRVLSARENCGDG